MPSKLTCGVPLAFPSSQVRLSPGQLDNALLRAAGDSFINENGPATFQRRDP